MSGCHDSEKDKLKVDYSDIQEIHRVLESHRQTIWYHDPQQLKDRISKQEKWSHIVYKEICDQLEKLQQSREANSRTNKEICERLDKLEKENLMRQNTIACIDSAYDKAYREMEEKLDKLKQHKNYQIDENRKISRRADDLEKENDFTHGEIISQLAKLNEKIERIRSECKVAFENKNEKPHKCPVCDGLCYGFSPCQETIDGKSALKQLQCNACRGKGIVWK